MRYSRVKQRLFFASGDFRLCIAVAIAAAVLGGPVVTVHAQIAITHSASAKKPWYANLQRPRGHHFNGKTYFTYQASGADYLDPYVMSYDHTTGAITGPVKVGDNPLASRNDTHGNPALIVDDVGYIHVVYGGHGIRGQQKHAVSKRPEDITSGWETLDNIDPTSTYPSWIKTADGSIYLFYRDAYSENDEYPKGNHLSDWVYQKSTDNGRTFGPKVKILDGGKVHTNGEFGKRYGDAWYMSFHAGRDRKTIHMSGVYHACLEISGGDLLLERSRSRFNLYHMVMDTSGTWRNATGKDLTTLLPLSEAEADTTIKAYDSGTATILGSGGLDTDTQDRPYINFPEKPYTNLSKMLIWDGNAWITKDRPAGGALFVESPSHLLIYSGQKKYESIDGGNTWSDEVLTHEPVVSAQRIFAAHPDAKWAAFEGLNNPQRNRVYLWGASGFVGPGNRPISTALLPVADSYTRAGALETIHSNAGTSMLVVRDTGADGPGDRRKGGDRIAYLKFDLSSVFDVERIKLRLYRETGTGKIAVYGVEDNGWQEETLTSSSAPSLSSGPLAKQIIDGSARSVEWDVSNYVRRQHTAGEMHVTLALVEQKADDSTAVVFASRDSDESRGPQLVTTSTLFAAIPDLLSNSVRLSAAIPNPFRQHAHIKLAAAKSQKVHVTVFDALGRRVATLFDGPLSKGRTKHLLLEAGSLSSGVYFIHVVGEKGAVEIQKVVLVR